MAQTSNKTGAALGAAAIAAAAVAAAAGGYWLYGAKDAAKNRKAVKSWMLRARAEVMDAVEKLKDVDKETYLQIVDEVGKRYAGLSGVGTAEVKQLISDLQDSWRYIAKQKGPATRRAKKMVRSAKSAAPKAKKAAKKRR